MNFIFGLLFAAMQFVSEEQDTQRYVSAINFSIADFTTKLEEKTNEVLARADSLHDGIFISKTIEHKHRQQAAIADSKLCFAAAKEMERKHDIAEHLLVTIASVETGKYDYKQQQYVAWPWTVNAKGKGYYFDSKAEAIAKVKELQNSGIDSIDVGCMQVNLKYHKDAFANLEDAFDPKKNVEYSALFLRKLYKLRGEDWNAAAMAYHSKDPVRGEQYKLRLDSRYSQMKMALQFKDSNVF